MLSALQVEPTPPALDTDGMEATHLALAELIGKLIKADKQTFPACFQVLLSLFKLHLAEEGGLMRASRYPGIAEHEGEHHRVLGELVQINRSLKRGRIALARAYVKEGLAPWLDLHMSTMDDALAAHLERTAA